MDWAESTGEFSPGAPPRRVLVAKSGGIGDFLLTLPVFAALRRFFPAARVEILGQPKIAALAVAGGLAGAAHSLESREMAGLFAPNAVLSARQADFFSAFDLIISFLYDPEKTFEANLSRITKARFLRGIHRPNESEKTHAAQQYLSVLEPLGIRGADPVPRLSLEAQPPANAVLPPPIIACHPGSGSRAKNWPEDRWRELLQKILGATKASLLLVGGEAEEGVLERLQTFLPPARAKLAVGLDLPVLAGYLLPCRIFVGHDSGLTHLAAALGLRSLVLWGPTNETVWKPLGEEVTILRSAAGLPGIPVETVFAQLAPLD